MRSRVVVLISAVAICVTLSGCTNGPSVAAKKAQIEQYQTTVKQTLAAYNSVSKFADDNKEEMLDLVFGIKSSSDLYAESLDYMDLGEFSRDSVVYDKYFTAYGATGVREVLQFPGFSTRLYVTVVWGTDSIISIERQVVRV